MANDLLATVNYQTQAPKALEENYTTNDEA